MDTFSDAISIFAKCTGIWRGLLGGAYLDCSCCVKSLVWREGVHIGSLSSLPSSSFADLSYAHSLSSSLERQLVPLESFLTCPNKALCSFGYRKDFTCRSKCSSHHGVALRSGRLLQKLLPLALPGEKAGCGNCRLLHRRTFTQRCRMNSWPY